MLDVKEMLLGQAQRLSFVSRFSTTKVLRVENVAEHSFYVAFYSMLIVEWLDSQPMDAVDTLLTPTEKYECLAKALVHDIEECVSGDFPRPFKYSNPKLKALHDEASKEAAYQTLYSLSTGNENCDRVMFKSLLRHWENSKDSSQSGLIVKFADFLSVLSYVCDEVRSGNKKTLQRHMVTLTEYLELFKKPAFGFIEALVDQAEEILDEEFANG